MFFILLLPVSDDRILELLGDGTESDIEEFHDDEHFEVEPRVLTVLVGEDDNSEGLVDEIEPEPLSQVTAPYRGRSCCTPLQQVGSRERCRRTISQMQSRRGCSGSVSCAYYHGMPSIPTNSDVLAS